MINYTEEDIFVTIFQNLLAEGAVPEENVEDVAHYMMDKPEIYPEYFPDGFLPN